MSAKSEHWSELTVDQLSFKVGKEADDAWAEVRIIQEIKHRPAIFYSEVKGYRIFDKDSLTMQQAKAFHLIHSIAIPIIPIP